MKKTTKLAAAVELGRLGGLKGGPARALSLSAAKRKQIARNAANARWAREKGTGFGSEKDEIEVIANWSRK